VKEQEGHSLSQQGQDAPPERRRFLVRLTLGLGGLIAAALAVPAVGFVFWPLRRKVPQVWRPVGRVEDFSEGATVKVTYQEAEALPWAGKTAYGAAYVRREASGFVAFSAFCTHTACPVRWVQGAQLFLCPCHGGAFHANGAVAAGPPPAPLPRLGVRVRDGLVEIQPPSLPMTT
jgi:menaquinol-cytochrome c reductase iron-sulfur subunit